MNDRPKKDQRKRLGEKAEEAVAEYLVRDGYELVERNFECKIGEVDIIARKGECLCFVEVRSRSTDSMGSPALTVNARKQRQVVRAALWYLSKNEITNMVARFDVAAVTFGPVGPEIEYIPSAFDAGM
jgi:putative endonuclease